MKLIDMVVDATDTGRMRRMLGSCSYGERVNHVRDALQPREGEDAEAYGGRVRRQLRIAASARGCFSYDSCASCPDAHDLLAETAAQEYYCQVDHARTAIAALGASGPERRLPNACPVGKTINELLAVSDDAGGEGGVALDALASKYGCTAVESCLHCPLGRGVLHSLLGDLSDSGMDGEAGEALRDEHPSLV